MEGSWAPGEGGARDARASALTMCKTNSERVLFLGEIILYFLPNNQDS